MKILLLGAFGEGALENYYLRGLKMVNKDVTTYDIATAYYEQISRSLVNKVINKIAPNIFFAPLNQALERFVKGKHFDVILVFKGLALFPQTISLLKRHTVLLCCYNPDHPFKFFSEGSGNANIRKSIRLYDLYITYARRITSDLRNHYGVNAFTIPFGYDDKAAKEGCQPPAGINNKWLFIGAYDHGRASFIKELGKENVAVFGDHKWQTRNRYNALIQAVYQGRSLYGDEYKTAVASGFGVFNLLRRQNIEEDSHNMRTFEVPGYGGLLIANRTTEQMAFFEEDKEAIYFDSLVELKDKLNYLEANPGKALQMKRAAMERSVRSNYSYLQRSSELYQLFLYNLK
jgi:spore maturation protein CgeB